MFECVGCTLQNFDCHNASLLLDWNTKPAATPAASVVVAETTVDQNYAHELDFVYYKL